MHNRIQAYCLKFSELLWIIMTWIIFEKEFISKINQNGYSKILSSKHIKVSSSFSNFLIQILILNINLFIKLLILSLIRKRLVFVRYF